MVTLITHIFLAFPTLRIYPVRFGWHTVKWMPVLKTQGQGRPEILEQGRPINGPQVFASMDDLDTPFWEDAHFGPILVYLRGNTSLHLPQRWQEVFPRHI